MDTRSELISIFIRKIFPLRIIISERNHPHSEEFASRDYFFQGEFIPIRKNLLPGIIFPRRMHPCSEKSLFRDYFPETKASLLEESPVRDYFPKAEASLFGEISFQGLFSPDKIIPIRKNLPPGMLWKYKSIRHGRKSKLKMYGNRPEAASGICQTSKSNFRMHGDRKQHSKSRDSSR